VSFYEEKKSIGGLRKMKTITPRSNLGKTQDSILGSVDQAGKKNPLLELMN